MARWKSKLSALAAAMLAGMLVFGCTNGEQSGSAEATEVEKSSNMQAEQPEEQRQALPIRVSASIFPPYDFARQIGGEYAMVEMVVPPGADAHDFAPTELELADIYESQMFLYTSNELEPWAQTVVAGNEGALYIADLSEGILSKETQAPLPAELTQEKPTAQQDGHIWLDMDHAAVMADAIVLAFCEVDPAHMDDYKANGDKLKAELKTMDESFRDFFAGRENFGMVFTGPFAYRYFTERYGVHAVSDYVDCAGAASLAREDADALRQEFIQRYGVNVRYYDPLMVQNPTPAEGMTDKIFYSAHTVAKEQMARDFTFIMLMEENLQGLKAAVGE